MDLTTILIGLGFLIIFIGPIALLIVIQKKKQKAKTKKLFEVSKKHNLSPEVVETTSMIAIGLDPNAKQVVVVEPRRNDAFEVVNLQDVKSCRIRTSGASNGQSSYTYVGIDLATKGKGAKEVELTFYDDQEELNLTAEAELLRAKKWQELLEKHLS